MKTSSYSYRTLIGIDVSKNKLDLAVSETGSRITIGNTKREIAKWISTLSHPRETLVVMEATGGYESQLVELLHEQGIALAVVNPRQVRDFAKGIGIAPHRKPPSPTSKPNSAHSSNAAGNWSI
jgi:transposase